MQRFNFDMKQQDARDTHTSSSIFLAILENLLFNSSELQTAATQQLSELYEAMYYGPFILTDLCSKRGMLMLNNAFTSLASSAQMIQDSSGYMG
eukprot:11360-Heterococcus_DN1.PRE.2